MEPNNQRNSPATPTTEPNQDPSTSSPPQSGRAEIRFGSLVTSVMPNTVSASREAHQEFPHQTGFHSYNQLYGLPAPVAEPHYAFPQQSGFYGFNQFYTPSYGQLNLPAARPAPVFASPRGQFPIPEGLLAANRERRLREEERVQNSRSRSSDTSSPSRPYWELGTMSYNEIDRGSSQPPLEVDRGSEQAGLNTFTQTLPLRPVGGSSSGGMSLEAQSVGRPSTSQTPNTEARGAELVCQNDCFQGLRLVNGTWEYCPCSLVETVER